ncbi:histone-lysine N-methyltransferase SETMAR [Trichonephila clavipes]|nr:histone-lysine N-methyltransferase SETMAR [Trichonephila clavipes]
MHIYAHTFTFFLTGDVLLSVPEELPSTSNHRDRWELLQNIKRGFWKKWSSEFISSLQPRKKWQDAQPNLKEDDIVLIKEEGPPGTWPMARVLQVHPGNDGLVRVATVKTQDSVKGKNAVQARKKLTDVYGEGVLTIRQCQNWFAKFRFGNFDVEDAPRSERPVEADKDAIKALVNTNRRITTREIELRLNLSNSTLYDHLKGLGLSSKLDVWVSHVLTERNLCRRIDVCDSLPKRHENDPFLKRIITGDEKGRRAKKMNRLKPFPKPIFTKKR